MSNGRTVTTWRWRCNCRRPTSTRNPDHVHLQSQASISIKIDEDHVGVDIVHRYKHLHTAPGQDEFVKRCEASTTETARTKNKVSVGYYSKEDMKNILKWSTKLDIISMVYEDPMYYDCTCMLKHNTFTW